MQMIEAVKSFFVNYVNFSGRATRAEYWWVVLFNFIIGFVCGLLSGILGDAGGIFLGIAGLYSMATLVPSISLAFRRLHDIGYAGWVYFACWAGSLLCGIGSIVMIVFACKESGPDNQWGPNKLGMME